MSTATVASRVRAKTKPQMWVANMDELRTLVEICRELEATSQGQVRDGQISLEEKRKSEFRKYRRPDEPAAEFESEWAAENAAQLDKLSGRISLVMQTVLKSYGTELEGTPEAILATIDRPQEVQTITLRLGIESGDYLVGAHSGFRLVIDKYGAAVSVFASNSDWIDLAISKLQNALRRERPWFFWMRDVWFAVVGIILPPAFLLSAILVPLRKISLFLPVWAGATIVETVVVIAFVNVAWPRLMPMFELVAEAKRARGAIALSAIGALLVWLAGTIVMPLILSSATRST